MNQNSVIRPASGFQPGTSSMPDHDPWGDEASEALITIHRGPRYAERDTHRLAPKVAYQHRQDAPFAALAPGDRGSDVLCTVGWSGPVNLAHQHLAICPDLAGEFDSLNTHAAWLIGEAAWSFFWD